MIGRKRFVCVASIAALFPVTSAFASQLRMHVQVNDVHGKPVSNIGVSIAGHGISGMRTSKQGTTRLTLPPDIGLADPVSLQLEADTGSNWVFIQPWNGVVTVPKTSSHTLLVLAKPGDRQILETGAGVMAVLTKIDKNLAAVKKTQQSNNEKLLATLKKTTKEFGFTPQEVEKAAKKRQSFTLDSKEKSAIASYTTDITTLLAYLDQIPDYTKKQRKLALLNSLNNMLTTAIGLYAQQLPGFQSVQSGFQIQPDRSSVGNSIGVQNAVIPEIVVWPRFFILIDDEEIVVIKAQEQELLRKPVLDVTEETIGSAIRNYFTPLIQKATAEYSQKKL